MRRTPPSPRLNRLDREIDDADHTLGNPSAQFTLVEYDSYACPNCRAANEAIADVRDQFGQRHGHPRVRPLGAFGRRAPAARDDPGRGARQLAARALRGSTLGAAVRPDAGGPGVPHATAIGILAAAGIAVWSGIAVKPEA